MERPQPAGSGEEQTQDPAVAPQAVAPQAGSIDPQMLELLQGVFELVRQGDTEQIGPLLDHGLPANLLNQKGDSLLMLASYHGHAATARLLLEHGGDPELYNDRGQTPLAGAVFKGDEEMVRLLLDHGAKVDGSGPDGKTPLMMAAMFNRTALVELLISRGASLHTQEAGGLSLVDAARVMGAADTAAQLEILIAQNVGAENG